MTLNMQHSRHPEPKGSSVIANSLDLDGSGASAQTNLRLPVQSDAFRHGGRPPLAELYALACSSAATASSALIAAHTADRGRCVALSEAEAPLLMALARVRTAAGALSVVAGLMLVQVRQEQEGLPTLPAPVFAEPGVTVRGETPNTDYSQIVRALAAASAEADAAVEMLRLTGASTDLSAAMTEMVDLIERIAQFL